MTKNVVILGANGAIARLVTTKILNDSTYDDIQLTLLLRKSNRIHDLVNGNERVTVSEGDVMDQTCLLSAMHDQDIVFAAMGATKTIRLTQGIIDAMKANYVKRVISINDLGIYGEVPGAFGKWNKQMVGEGLKIGRQSADLLENSGLDYTTLRLAWLSNHSEVNYEITQKGKLFRGTTVSRASVADVVLRIIADPSFANKVSIGIDQPGTDSDRPVY